MIAFWKGIPTAGRAFIGACAFALAGAMLGSFVGHDGVGALLGGCAYAALVIKLDRIP